jgi:hypothetical protein
MTALTSMVLTFTVETFLVNQAAVTVPNSTVQPTPVIPVAKQLKKPVSKATYQPKSNRSTSSKISSDAK